VAGLGDVTGHGPAHVSDTDEAYAHDVVAPLLESHFL
jgi:hypothetical protein